MYTTGKYQKERERGSESAELQSVDFPATKLPKHENNAICAEYGSHFIILSHQCIIKA